MAVTTGDLACELETTYEDLINQGITPPPRMLPGMRLVDTMSGSEIALFLAHLIGRIDCLENRDCRSETSETIDHLKGELSRTKAFLESINRLPTPL